MFSQARGIGHVNLKLKLFQKGIFQTMCQSMKLFESSSHCEIISYHTTRCTSTSNSHKNHYTLKQIENHISMYGIKVNFTMRRRGKPDKCLAPLCTLFSTFVLSLFILSWYWKYGNVEWQERHRYRKLWTLILWCWRSDRFAIFLSDNYKKFPLKHSTWFFLQIFYKHVIDSVVTTLVLIQYYWRTI